MPINNINSEITLPHFYPYEYEQPQTPPNSFFSKIRNFFKNFGKNHNQTEPAKFVQLYSRNPGFRYDSTKPSVKEDYYYNSKTPSFTEPEHLEPKTNNSVNVPHYEYVEIPGSTQEVSPVDGKGYLIPKSPMNHDYEEIPDHDYEKLLTTPEPFTDTNHTTPQNATSDYEKISPISSEAATPNSNSTDTTLVNSSINELRKESPIPKQLPKSVIEFFEGFQALE